MPDFSRRWLICLLVPAFAPAQNRGPAVTVFPDGGAGSSRLFVLKASGKKPASTSLLISSTRTTDHACYLSFDADHRKISLRDDAGENAASTGEPGQSGVAGNNQCSIDFQRSTVSDTPDLAVSLAIAFQPNFAGPKTVWARTDKTGWDAVGKWTAKAALNLGSPAFSPIMTPSDPPMYHKYDGDVKTELDSKANHTTLPHRFREPESVKNREAAVSGMCIYADSAPLAPPFWFDFTGNSLGGKPKFTIPSEYFVSSIRPDAGYGVQILGSFAGALKGAGTVYETAYFHQQRCDDGGLEFGFYRNVIPAQTVFYFSNNSNCGIQPNGYCHVSNSFSSQFINEDNYPGQALMNNVHGWEIQNLTLNGMPAQSAKLTYSVFVLPDRASPKGYRFQVEVFDGASSTHARCDVKDNTGKVLFLNKPCGFPVRPDGWYSIDDLYKRVQPAYITVGVQRQGATTVVKPIDFAVEKVSVPK